MSEQIKCIGIGEVGVGIVEKLPNEGSCGDFVYQTIAISTKPEDFMNIAVARQVQIGVETCQSDAITDEIELGRAALCEQLGVVMEQIDYPDYVIIFADFGIGEAIGATLEIALTLQLVGTPVFCLPVKPFEFEGQRREKLFYDGIIKLAEMGILFTPVLSSDYTDDIGENRITLQKLFDRTDFQIALEFINILKLQ